LSIAVLIIMKNINENDEAYANAAFIANSEQIVQDWIAKAELFRKKSSRVD